jgi:hypothetical protein
VTCMKAAVFRNVIPYSLVDTGRRFREDYCLHHQGYHLDDTDHDSDQRFRGDFSLYHHGDDSDDGGSNLL